MVTSGGSSFSVGTTLLIDLDADAKNCASKSNHN
jgi:hypothetical protein